MTDGIGGTRKLRKGKAGGKAAAKRARQFTMPKITVGDDPDNAKLTEWPPFTIQQSLLGGGGKAT